jgi:NAD-dependent deacetylase
MRTPLVVLTGAGISAESGVPTFRGPGGMWNEYRPEDLATPQAFAKDPILVWRFYAWRREVIHGCQPNPGHRWLASLESETEFTLITQNVDGLHQQAGSKGVLELHGNIWRVRCTICRHRWEDSDVPLVKLPPECPACGSIGRPDVVWFGESLPADIYEQAVRRSRAAGTFVLVGTSAQVYPAAGLALVAKEAGAKLVEINTEPTPLSEIMDACYRGKASEMLPRWLSQEQESH